nr:filamentous hemagglutinin N-terminal domain-containing protein [Dyella flava]
MKIRVKPLALLVSLLASGQAAAVQNGNVTGGDASITQNGATTTIQQHSDRAIVAWNNFDIGQGERVNIQQPNANAAILNRVVGASTATQIQGALDANGRVFVINPNGIVVGPQGTINANSVVLSTADLRDSDFMGADSFLLGSPGEGDGIRNDGAITAPQGAYLFSNQVVNGPSGQITAEQGWVTLAAAQLAHLILLPDGSIGMLPLDGSQTNVLAANDGHITAGGGVRVQASGTGTSGTAIVRNTGTIEAKGMDGLIGATSATLIATGGAKATIDLRGTISANQIYARSTGDLNVDGAALLASTEGPAASSVWLSGQNITVGPGGLEFLGSLFLTSSNDKGTFTQNGDITSARGSITAQGLSLFAQQAGTTTLDDASGSMTVRADNVTLKDASIGRELWVDGTQATVDGALTAQRVTVSTNQLDITRHGVIDAANVTLFSSGRTNIAGRVTAASRLSITGYQGVTQTAEASLRFGDAMTLTSLGNVTLNGTIDAGSWYTVNGLRFAAGVYQPGQGYGGANALPGLTRGGVITSGAGSITQNGDTTQVAQTSDKLIIDWLDFNIAANQSITFLQPDANAAVLNKVTSGKTTTIDGALTANGRVFVLNPYGIVVGKSGTINANSITLAAGSLSDEDFFKDNASPVSTLDFTLSNPVKNEGTIATLTGATLLGTQVFNLGNGQISSDNGNIGLVAGGHVRVRQNDDGSLRGLDVDGAMFDSALINEGRITAGNGFAQLEVYSFPSVGYELIHNTGEIEAINRSGTAPVPGELGAGDILISGHSDFSSPYGATISGRLTGQNITLHNDGKLTINATGGGSIDTVSATHVTLSSDGLIHLNGNVIGTSTVSITGQQGVTQTEDGLLRSGDAMTIASDKVTLNGTIDAGSGYSVNEQGQWQPFAAGVYQPGQAYGAANALPGLPNNGVITAGSGSITTAGDATNVVQTSDKLIIDWRDFNIAFGESLNFLQPNANAAVLNKVTSGKTSTINGALTANGRVFILNPYGIVIGPTGTINANSVTLAAGSILADEDFLMGDTWNVNTSSGSGQQGLVQNHGTIATKTGVTLIGNQVLNLTSGRITTGKGNLSMVAGGMVQLSQSNDGSVSKVDALTSTNNALVANDGRITVDNGYAQLEAYTDTPNQGEIVRSLGQIDALNRSGDVSAPGEPSAGNILIRGRSSDESSGTVDIRGRLNGQNITVHSDGDLNLYSAALTTWQRGADPSKQKVTLEGNRIIVGPEGLTIDGSAVLRGVGNAPVFDQQGPFTVIGNDVSLIDLDLTH